MTNNEMTLNEFKEVFAYLLDNNKHLEDNNLRPIAVGVEGEAGIGKTSLIEDIAKERDIQFKAIRLESKEQAQNAPTPITTYALFSDGDYLTNEQMNDKRFIKLLEK